MPCRLNAPRPHSSHFFRALLRVLRDSEMVGRGGERETWNTRDPRLEINKTRNKRDLTVYKYHESSFEMLRVRTNDTISKFSKNNSNKSNNEYYKSESIFEKFMSLLETWRRAAKIETSIFGYHIIRLRMTFEYFCRFSIGFVDSIQVCPTQQ